MADALRESDEIKLVNLPGFADHVLVYGIFRRLDADIAVCFTSCPNCFDFQIIVFRQMAGHCWPGDAQVIVNTLENYLGFL